MCIRDSDKASFSLPENSYGQISLTIPLTDKDIDAVLINGGNHDGGRLPVISEFSKGKSNEELGSKIPLRVETDYILMKERYLPGIRIKAFT